jgi:predicted HTH domain antitoxin
VFKIIISKNTGLTCVEINQPSQEVYDKIIKICHSYDVSDEKISIINRGVASFFKVKKKEGMIGYL